MKQKLMLKMQYLLGLLTRKINGPNVVALVVKTDNGIFAVDPEDRFLGREIRMKGSYGVDEIENLKPFITRDSRTLVVGAHIGTLAIPLSKLCGEVIAIEANPNTFELLTRNIALNAASNCHAINIAAGNKEETIQFLLSRTNSGGSKRTPINKEYMYYYDKPKEISIKAFSLDEYLDDDSFDIVVMDIEGSEYFALQGMQHILSKAKLLAVEFLPHHIKNVSGITVEQFLSVIEPHFSKLTVPTKNITVDADNFLSCLSEMYARGQGDNGIIFQNST